MGNTQRKIDILKQIFPDSFVRKDTEFVTFCPKHYHHKKKLEISVANDRFSCWVCKYGGFVSKLLNEYANSSQKTEYFSLIDFDGDDIQATKSLKLPDEYVFLLDALHDDRAQIAYKWLKENEIDEKTILQNKIGICFKGSFSNRIIFPSYNENGDVNFFTSRVFLDEDKRMKYFSCEAKLSKVIYNELFIDWKKPIIIIEGVKTYLKNFDKIPNMVVLSGTNLSSSYELFKKIILNDCPVVYLALDAEAKRQSFKIITKLQEYGICVKYVDIPNQPDLLSTNEFKHLLQEAREPDNFDKIRFKLKELS